MYLCTLRVLYYSYVIGLSSTILNYFYGFFNRFRMLVFTRIVGFLFSRFSSFLNLHSLKSVVVVCFLSV